MVATTPIAEACIMSAPVELLGDDGVEQWTLVNVSPHALWELHNVIEETNDE